MLRYQLSGLVVIALSIATTKTDLAKENTDGVETTNSTNGYLDVQADITLLLDVGGDVSAAQQADFTSFFVNALSQFNLGWQKNLQVSIINVYGNDKNVALLHTPFSGIANSVGLYNAVARAYDGFSTTAGQTALKDGFNLAISPTGMYGGYRTNINNHLIVYATTNGTADFQAISSATGVLETGMYNVAAVAYGANGSNTAALTFLVGGKSGCVITANDANGLTSAAANSLATLIWNAANNNGVYC